MKKSPSKKKTNKPIPRKVQSPSKEKEPLSLVIPIINPYKGHPIYRLEYSELYHIILLNDIRKWYRKALPEFAIDIESNEDFDLEKFENTCPDHYEIIFNKEQSYLNTELIKTEYPKYYDFITTFNINEITVECFKETYAKVIQELKRRIRKLVTIRQQIDIYNDLDNKFSREISKQNYTQIRKYERSINNENNSIINKQNKKTGTKVTKKQILSKVAFVKGSSKSSKDKTPKKNSVITVNKGKNKINTKSSLDTQIEKFVWLKSQDALECLFEDLSENKYIKDYSKKLLYQHFTIKSEHKLLYDSKDKLEYKKINWKSKNTNLVVLIFQLRLDGSIFFTGDRYHKMAFDHFDKDGNDLNTTSLKSAKSQITNKRTGYIDKPIFQELRDLIKRNKQT